MKTLKPSVKYQGISVPITLIQEIKKCIKDKPEYRSIAEFVKEAIREKIQQSDNKFDIEEFKKIDKSMKNITNTINEIGKYFDKTGLNPELFFQKIIGTQLRKIVNENKTKK